MSKSEREVSKKRRKKRSHPVRTFFKVLAAALFSVFVIALIVISIVAAALTVYVIQFRENTPVNIDLDDLGLAYTTFIYGYDENGQEVEMAHISRNANRIPVSIDEVPQHVRDAFVYTEDEHFYEHAGVNWTRTFGAVINAVTNNMLYGYKQGGSTITQQLIKNVTGDDDQTWDRKLREIFRAHDLEQYRTKEEILEAYLNCIGFGGSCSGIEAAAQKYFGKSVSELDIAEAACLAAIPRSPESFNPFASREANKTRQEYVLGKMLENAAISEKQYKEAMAEELKIVDPNSANTTANDSDVQNWYVDTVIRDVITEFSEMYGLSREDASDKLYNGGYKIYCPVDIEMQKEVEEKFRDYRTFSYSVVSDPPNAAFIAMDYRGNILAIAGDVGAKAGANVWNFATMEPRQPASTLKPLGPYAYAIENNTSNWSRMIEDAPIDIEDENDSSLTRQWPTNYSETEEDAGWSMEPVPMYKALEKSLNTVSARLVLENGAHNIFDFIQNKYQFSELDPNDSNMAPMAVGSVTNGVYLEELVAAYQVFGGTGTYFKPTSYTRVEDSSGNTILEHTYTSIQAISEDTSAIMNHMMREVVEGSEGTAQAAKLERVAVAGKTGTAQNWQDNIFIACTPDYVSGIWYGYKKVREVPVGTYYGTAQVWKNVFGDIADRAPNTDFRLPGNVVQHYYCTETGLLASEGCEHIARGYYKASQNLPLCEEHGKEPHIANTDPTEYDRLVAEGEFAAEENSGEQQSE